MRRHECYIDSTPSIITAIAAAVDEAEERLGADAFTSPDKTLSSLRAQPDLCESSTGQATRLKFALCEISILLRVDLGLRTLETLCL